MVFTIRTRKSITHSVCSGDNEIGCRTRDAHCVILLLQCCLCMALSVCTVHHAVMVLKRI